MAGLSPSSPRVWVITGCSSGLGKALALAVIKASENEKVIATSRNISRLSDLQAAGATAIQVDPNADLPILKQFAEEAIKVHGKVDVLVNNAAFVAYGTIEESSPEYTFQQYHTNVFSPLNMIRAFLPHFRARREGTIGTIGSIGARLRSPNLGLYHGAKAALRSSHLALDLEVRPLGIKTCLIEPGGFRTSLLSSHQGKQSFRTAAGENHIADYDSIREASAKRVASVSGHQLGNPELGALRIYEVLTGTGMAAAVVEQGKGYRGARYQVPDEVLLGSDCYQATKLIMADELALADQWKDFTCSTDFRDGSAVEQMRTS